MGLLDDLEYERQMYGLLGRGLLDQPIAPPGRPEEPDYDIQGFVQKYGQPDQSKGQHLTDEFKLLNHPTFSKESRYSNDQTPGGEWSSVGEMYRFKPSAFNMQNITADDLAHYFKWRERRGTSVELPDGRIVEGML